MTPRVRPARPADRPALRALQSQLPRAAPRLLDHGLRTGGVLVTVADGRPVGYLLAVGTTFAARSSPPEPGGRFGAPETDAPPEASDGRTTGAHLAELVVAPPFRREGRATALLARLFAAVDGPVTVATSPDAGAALALYRSRGFEPVERLEDHFDDGPALWLVRR